MTRQLTASLESGDALLSITVPVSEETGDHLPGGSAWFAFGDVHGRWRVYFCG